MEYEVCIQKLSIKAIIGSGEVERKKKQRIVVETYILYEGSVLDYADIKKAIVNNIKKRKYELLEEALVGVMEMLANKFKGIKKVRISLKKPDVLKDCVVGVSAERDVRGIRNVISKKEPSEKKLASSSSTETSKTTSKTPKKTKRKYVRKATTTPKKPSVAKPIEPKTTPEVTPKTPTTPTTTEPTSNNDNN